MVIREFTKEDQGCVEAFIEHIMDDEFAVEHSTYKYNDTNDIKEAYSGKRDVFYVVFFEDELIATVAVKEDDNSTALIRRLLVKKTFRQKGFGQKILNKAIQFCKDNDYKRMIFRCTNNMKGAINVTMKKGFKEKDIIDLGEYKIFQLEKEL